MRRYILTLSCPDRVGIVAAVSTFIAQHQGWITEAQHHSDHGAQRFFMRQEILAESLSISLAEFRLAFAEIATAFHMTWNVTDTTQKKRVVILVSKLGHCLYDLLARWQSGELEIEISAVLSNHEHYRDLVEWHRIPFHYIPVTPETKAQAFAHMQSQLTALDVDLLVLARYMQVLPPQLCDRYPNQIINIHHSFLPSFVGAKPYHRAYERGVKLIGATCHYVTAELDAGPIIDQDVIRVNHSDAVEDLVRYGKDIEKIVLARGLRYHIEDRVLVFQNKTVVFR